jgi:hypothetical protein
MRPQARDTHERHNLVTAADDARLVAEALPADLHRAPVRHVHRRYMSWADAYGELDIGVAAASLLLAAAPACSSTSATRSAAWRRCFGGGAICSAPLATRPLPRATLHIFLLPLVAAERRQQGAPSWHSRNAEVGACRPACGAPTPHTITAATAHPDQHDTKFLQRSSLERASSGRRRRRRLR